MQKKNLILGIDVGGTGIKGGLVDVATGKLATERHRILTPKPATPKAVAAKVKELVEHFGYEGPIGAGFPAIVQRGVARSAANISNDWIGVSIEDLFSKAVGGLPVYALNDADAAGIADMAFGAGKDYQEDRTVLLLTIGTGIGSALFIDGKIVPNTELGHLYLRNHKLDAEDYVSNLLRKKHNWSWNKFGNRLNKYLVHVNMLFSPDLIVLGGGVSKNFEKYHGQFEIKTPIVPAELLNAAGTVGAAMYAHQRKQK